MRIVMAGSSGFLGSHLAARLSGAGHQVVRLVRREVTGPAEVRWRPEAGELDPGVLDGADAVVNLAGAGVGDERWTDAYKKLIRSSRVDTTNTLAAAIAAAGHRPGVLLNASAVGYYGDTGDTPVDETAPPGTGFFPDTCQAWEAATEPATAAGVRVVRMRTGLVLGRGGGLLRPVLRLFRLGLGGRLGDGRAYQPWISLADHLAAMEFLLATPVSGPVNLTGPVPVTNAEFTRALGEAVHRPAVLPVPGVALRVALGEFASEALASLRVLPAALTAAGYRFQHRDVRAALAWAVRGGSSQAG